MHTTPITPTFDRAIRRSYVDVPDGQVHLAECGPRDAPAVLMFHQSPRSWREFAAVLPLIGREYRAIAMDTVGFGDSMAPPWPPTIERWAATAASVLDALKLGDAHVVGHHTGGVTAIELAAQHPDRVKSLVLSSAPFIDAAGRALREKRPAIDVVEPSEDGSHLKALWGRRQPFYPPGRPDLLQAYVLDALRVSGDPEEGHRVVARYRMEDRIGLVRQPALILRALDDPYASPEAEHLAAHLPGARILDIPGGMVPLPDQMPVEFSNAVLGFLKTLP
jgi:pimeloyl-ACP methyl ester carboxylesterase